jgi:hypothetical protein
LKLESGSEFRNTLHGAASFECAIVAGHHNRRNSCAMPTNPTGSFSVPDLVLNQSGQVPVVIEARSIPLNANITLFLISDGNPDKLLNSTPPLVGTVALSNTTISKLIPPGYSRSYVRATF